MLWLRSNRSFGRLLEFDPVNGKSRELLASELGENVPKKVSGFFDFLNGTLTAIYAFAGRLFLRIGDITIPIEEGITVIASGDASNRSLRVKQRGNELSSINYSIVDAPKFADDPTAFIENEDFDFGLFIANVASSADRRSVALETW